MSRGHEAGCDCPAHRPPAQPGDGGWWSTLLPVLACAICPACLSTYAKVFSLVGIGVALTETQHHLLLLIAVGGSLAVSAWRSWRSRRVWPVLIAGLGCALVVGGHVAHLHLVEWFGIAILLVGGIAEHLRVRRARRQIARVAAVARLTERPWPTVGTPR